MATLETWLSKVQMENGQHCDVIQSSEVSIILYELQTNRVGIACGMFTLTYTMIANVSEANPYAGESSICKYKFWGDLIEALLIFHFLKLICLLNLFSRLLAW